MGIVSLPMRIGFAVETGLKAGFVESDCERALEECLKNQLSLSADALITQTRES